MENNKGMGLLDLLKEKGQFTPELPPFSYVKQNPEEEEIKKAIDTLKNQYSKKIKSERMEIKFPDKRVKFPDIDFSETKVLDVYVTLAYKPELVILLELPNGEIAKIKASAPPQYFSYGIEKAFPKSTYKFSDNTEIVIK